MYILKKEKTVINVDTDKDRSNYASAGWQELTPEQIAAAGMLGYEHLVSPANTIVNVDGSITFTPPESPSNDELYGKLRLEAERRLSLTDKYATVDYPDSALRETVLAYRADLRAINHQPGAPWDGGGELTPWPELPSVE